MGLNVCLSRSVVVLTYDHGIFIKRKSKDEVSAHHDCSEI